MEESPDCPCRIQTLKIDRQKDSFLSDPPFQSYKTRKTPRHFHKDEPVYSSGSIRQVRQGTGLYLKIEKMVTRKQACYAIAARHEPLCFQKGTFLAPRPPGAKGRQWAYCQRKTHFEQVKASTTDSRFLNRKTGKFNR